jgi:hypothetical protein
MTTAVKQSSKSAKQKGQSVIGLPFLYLDATELKACEARCATNRPGQAAPAG